jgi:hypothetical protein
MFPVRVWVQAIPRITLFQNGDTLEVLLRSLHTCWDGRKTLSLFHACSRLANAVSSIPCVQARADYATQVCANEFWRHASIRWLLDNGLLCWGDPLWLDAKPEVLGA